MKDQSLENFKLKEIIISQSEQIHDLKNESKIHYQNFLNQNTETSNKVLEIASQNGRIKILNEKLVNAKDTYKKLNITLNFLEEELENAYTCLSSNGFSEDQINKIKSTFESGQNKAVKNYVDFLLEDDCND